MRGRLSDDGDTGFTSSLFGAQQTALLYGRKNNNIQYMYKKNIHMVTLTFTFVYSEPLEREWM